LMDQLISPARPSSGQPGFPAGGRRGACSPPAGGWRSTRTTSRSGNSPGPAPPKWPTSPKSPHCAELPAVDVLGAGLQNGLSGRRGEPLAPPSLTGLGQRVNRVVVRVAARQRVRIILNGRPVVLRPVRDTG